MERPAMPALILSRPKTARKDASRTIKDPMNSKRKPSHRFPYMSQK